MSWLQAHRVAGIAVQRAHSRLGVDVTGVSVDVISALGAAEVMVLWRPLPQLFGAYVNEEGGVPGVLLHNGLPRAARRQTAAHELGHHWMKHSTSADDGSTIDTVAGEEYDEIPPTDRRRAWPDQEKVAEAFATWFLMPRRVVLNALDVLNLDKPRTSTDVYRLSLLLGTSYRTTVRHMTNLKLASPAQVAAWSKIAPAQIKAELDAGLAAPASRRADVWLLDARFGGHRIKVLPGDRLVVAAGAGDGGSPGGRSGTGEGVDLAAGVLRRSRAYERWWSRLGGGASARGDSGGHPGRSAPGARMRICRVEVAAAPAGIDPRAKVTRSSSTSSRNLSGRSVSRSARPKTNDVATGVFSAPTLSQAWLTTVAGVDAASQQKLFHTVTRIARPGLETDYIRAAADRLLAAKKMPPIETVANTIFPAAMAARCSTHEALVERYRASYPTLRRFDGNKAGTYFGRMVAFPSASEGEPFDQLGKIIDRLRQQLTQNGPMSTPYQLTIEAADDAGNCVEGAATDGVASDAVEADVEAGLGAGVGAGGDGVPAAPVYALSDNQVRGFPCMSFVHFQTDGHTLHAYAHYRYEYLIEKGYGNYLGLARLPAYIAAQVSLDVGVLTISAGRAQVDASSAQVKNLPHEAPLFD